jgi:hypothetical protein
MPVSSYGAYNPAAVDPWPIEQTLAPLATAGSSANAQRMLGDYQTQREQASNIYGMELDKQHQFNRDQLAQQLYEAKLKEMAPLLNAPGGAHLLGAGGIPGMNMGTDPTVMQGIIGAADLSQQSKNFQQAGTGYNQFAQGGAQVDLSAVPGMQGVNAGVTSPALVRAALIRAQATRDAAASRGAQESKVTVSGGTPATAEGDFVNVSRRVPASQVQSAIDAQNALNESIRDKRRGNATSLQPNASGQSSKLDTNSPQGKMSQGGVTIMVDRDSQSSDPRAQQRAADIKAGMKSGTTYDTAVNSHGVSVVRGKSGNYYPIQN